MKPVRAPTVQPIQPPIVDPMIAKSLLTAVQYAIARRELRAGTTSCGTQQQTTSPFACAPGRRRVPRGRMRRVLGSVLLGLALVTPASASALKDALAKLQG